MQNQVSASLRQKLMLVLDLSIMEGVKNVDPQTNLQLRRCCGLFYDLR